MIECDKKREMCLPAFYLLVLFLLFLAVSSGCVRVQGGAGATTLNGSDGEPTTHSVGFDTNDMLPAATSPGNIDVNE